MKAISLWQPWASLIAAGVKPYETRSWAPPRELIGQPIAIHAAKRIDKGAAQFAEELMYGQHRSGGFDLADRLDASMAGTPDELMGRFGQALMPIGCVVCIARLDAAFQLGSRPPRPLARRECRATHDKPGDAGMFHGPNDDFGDYAPGRWAWLLRDVKPLMPSAPVVGRQGIFELPHGWLAEGGDEWGRS